MNLASLSIKRPTFIFSVLAAFIIVGLILMSRMPVRMMPDVEYPYISVNISYSGAGPEEIESRISRVVENAMSSAEGIKHISSISSDGNSRTFAEFELSVDPETALQDVRDKIAAARRRFPDDIEEPVVQKFDPESRPIMVISLKSQMSAKELYDFADENYVKELLRIEGISNVNMFGGVRREIDVLVDIKKLALYDTTLSAVSASIANNSMNVPAGRIATQTGDISFRTIGEYRDVEDIKEVPVSFRGNDIAVSVQDVGRVEDTVVERYSVGRIIFRETDGEVVRQPSMLLAIFKQSGANEVNISKEVITKIEELNNAHKDDEGSPFLTLVTDNAKSIRENITDVQNTIFEGIFLAIVVVYFFLASWRSTFITALALPNSLIGSFIFMYFFGFSINIVTLMSLSLAVGLLIDDAIVVRENIYRHYEGGEEPDVAAQRGTDEVALAVVATTCSVIAVFLPVAFMSGLIGKFFKEFGLTVVFAMAISVIDALTIAPMLSAYIIPPHKKAGELEAVEVKKPLPSRIFLKFSQIVRACTAVWFEKFYQGVIKVYEKVLKVILKHKIKTIFVVLAAFAISLLPLALGKIPLNFMPTSETGEFNITLTAPPDYSIDMTNELSQKIEDIVMSFPEIDFVVASIGGNNQLNTASMNVRLVPSSKRKLLTEDVKTQIRQALNQLIAKDTFISIDSSGGMGGSQKPFAYLLYGRDTTQLSNLADQLIERFKTIPGLVDLTTNYQSGKLEYQIDIAPAKSKLFGVNTVAAGAELRAMITGNTPAVFRSGGLEYDIRVVLEQQQRRIMEHFDDIYVANVNGRRVKLSRIADLKKASSPNRIYRRDRSRYIQISGNLSKGYSMSSIQKEVEKVVVESKKDPALQRLWQGINPEYSGNYDDMKDLTRSIMMAAMLGLIFIFMVLASLYESLITPFIIMLAIPLGSIGGFLAIFLTGRSMDVFTMIGMLMLLGIVAKNSIILVDYIQQLIIRGAKTVDDAVIEAGKVRLRPILMTSFALIGGMVPTALALSESGKVRQGVGILIIGGIITSTFLTLLIVPAAFEYAYRFRLWTRKKLHRPLKRKIDTL
ncbi:MAG: efflux RND transporter permease subunit [Elusimicrobiota bacterium]|jgi:hydrophobe/amphiphile efflux-1 (HAE1) family protein|nr:efflux RND transporter permease subunit [Elusimicrobiota bacterium]